MKIFTNLRKEHFNLHIHRIFTKSAVHDDISIYTFAQDTTEVLRDSIKAISIHLSTQDATRLKNKIALSSVFQSTHPHRIQLQHIKIDTALVQISIHAPAQNATAIISTFFAFLYVMCSS